jgi:hypothetical protein
VLQGSFWFLAFCVVAAEGQGLHSEVARLVLVLRWILCPIPLSSLSPPQQGLPGELLPGAPNGSCAQLEAALPGFHRWQECIDREKNIFSFDINNRFFVVSQCTPFDHCLF